MTDDQPFGFTAKRFHLLQLMERAVTVVPGKNVYPLLSNFLVDINPGHLRVAATDMELSVISELTVVTCLGTGSVLIPAKRFLTILREAAEGDIAVQVTGGKARVTAGHASWGLVLQPADDYPPLADPQQVQFTPVKRERFLKALALVRGAASRDGTNPKLMAISIKHGTVIAASSVRLHKAQVDGFPLDLQIPIGAVDDLARLLGGCSHDEIGIGEEKYVLAFQIGSDVFTVGKLASEYPDMEERLLRGPKSANGQLLSLDKGDLVAAIRRVRITSDEESAAIGLRLVTGKVTVASRDRNGNQAEEEIPADWANKERLVVVNHEHLQDLLKLATGPQVTFRLGADAGKRRSPVVLTDDAAGTAGVIGQLSAVLIE